MTSCPIRRRLPAADRGPSYRSNASTPPCRAWRPACSRCSSSPRARFAEAPGRCLAYQGSWRRAAALEASPRRWRAARRHSPTRARRGARCREYGCAAWNGQPGRYLEPQWFAHEGAGALLAAALPPDGQAFYADQGAPRTTWCSRRVAPNENARARADGSGEFPALLLCVSAAGGVAPGTAVHLTSSTSIRCRASPDRQRDPRSTFHRRRRKIPGFCARAAPCAPCCPRRKPCGSPSQSGKRSAGPRGAPALQARGSRRLHACGGGEPRAWHSARSFPSDRLTPRRDREYPGHGLFAPGPAVPLGARPAS